MNVLNGAASLAALLVCAPAMAATTDPIGDIPPPGEDIVVTGRAQHLYRVDTTTVGKTAEDPLNIPQALQVINEELFTDQGARDATDIYRNISGVSALKNVITASLKSAGSGRWAVNRHDRNRELTQSDSPRARSVSTRRRSVSTLYT